MRTTKIIDYFRSVPKRIFLVDGTGALLTAFFLGVLLANFEEVFGMPGQILLKLSFVAVIYAVYSFGCYLFVRSRYRLFLTVIMIANCLYAFLTAVLVICFYHQLTVSGLVYFSLELIVMGILIVLEVKLVLSSPASAL